MRFDEKVAIVTGAGRGIGRAIALRLAGEGATIVVAEMDRASGEAVAGEVRALGRRSIAVQIDVTAAADRQRMVDETLKSFGKIDILVNNAGVVQVKPPMELTEADWDFVLAVNAKALFFCTQAVVPAMIGAGSGKIVNLASAAAKMGRPPFAHYAASKAAVVSITQTWAVELAPHHINVNCVCPGVVDTKMWDIIDAEMGRYLGLPRGEYMRSRIDQIPLGRVEKPEDVAGVAAFLCSADADYMTGQAINVTGGTMMH
ncbi:MAG: glucose 1-dehydrogenase [Chloroflexi bacterium]|nr:glucose 1-dehydrogenase [Chloroflexota bacterium]